MILIKTVADIFFDIGFSYMNKVYGMIQFVGLNFLWNKPDPFRYEEEYARTNYNRSIYLLLIILSLQSVGFLLLILELI